MCVPLFGAFKGCSLVKNIIDKDVILKTFRKSKLLEKKILRNALALKSKKVQGIFGETFIMALSSSAVFRLQNHVSDYF